MSERYRPFFGSMSSPKARRNGRKFPSLCLVGGFLLCVAISVSAQHGAAAPQSAASASPAQSLDPRQLLQQLDAVSLDSTQVYSLRDVQITRDGLKFYFNRGFVDFFAPVAGEITGAVFSGDGEVLLMPPNAAERQSLAQFTQTAILEERFVSVYLRFTDQTARELKARAELLDPEDPEQPGDFALNWAPVVRSLAPQLSLRVLKDMLGARDRPYFYARIGGVSLGTFEAIDDERAPEAIAIAAASQVAGKSYANGWCSFPSRPSEARAHDPAWPEIVVRSYKIDTRINPDNSLEGHAQLEIESRSHLERLFSFELSRSLKVSEVKDGQGQSVTFFQNPSLEESEAAERGNDLVAVVLPSPHPVGERYRLDFTYRGNVIGNVGNGVLFVGAHGSWYPNRGLAPQSQYDLTFHYPDHLSLVATGRLLTEDSSEGWKNSHWISDSAFPVAGFNLGVYDSVTRKVGSTTIEVYAARGAEASLEQRHAAHQPPDRVVTQNRGGSVSLEVLPKVAQPLAPAALVDRVAQHAADTVRLFELLFGPFPYPRLAISQIPGDFGQGWPELVYLPTLYFLPSETRSEMGFNTKSEELQNRLFLAHEIAHQWWGNEVGWKTYHDQWLSEGFATYAAALDLAREKDGDRSFRALLQSYRDDLLAKNKDGKTVESGGPIWLGERLTTSLNPTGYNSIVYDKACWVLHMLRMMMRDSSPAGETRGNPSRPSGRVPSSASAAASSNPAAEASAVTTEANEKFFEMLRGFVVAYRDQNPSTEDFARFAAKYMNPAMDLDHNGRLDWFFDDWVRGTGIPTYTIEATVRAAANRFAVEGTIQPSNVRPEFEMLVPVVAQSGKVKTLLGEVPVTDAGGRFKFVTSSKPSHVTIDGERILAVVK
jgi:Peptidase family M1 domain